MKKIITLFFLIVIVFQNVAVVGVLFTFYLNQNYIAKNICINRNVKNSHCNGKCYLNKQIKALENESPKKPEFKQNELTWFYNTPSVFELEDLHYFIKNSFDYKIEDLNQRNSSIFHPPPTS